MNEELKPCEVNTYLSSICSEGTLGCEVKHNKESSVIEAREFLGSDNCIGLSGEAEAIIINLMMYAESLESTWISVEDRFPLNEEDLPESGFACIELLTSTCNGFVYMDEYQIGSMPRFWGNFQRNDVTHWMPLPIPPKDNTYE